MRITCPHCGPRDLVEFSYHGDATLTRPDPASNGHEAWETYVYQRENPAGAHKEYWQHAGGCRKHLVLTRDTLTHAIGEIRFAGEDGQ
jgi:sarcosine oxidase subunit delta